jgi:hypothetical protein
VDLTPGQQGQGCAGAATCSLLLDGMDAADAVLRTLSLRLNEGMLVTWCIRPRDASSSASLRKHRSPVRSVHSGIHGIGSTGQNRGGGIVGKGSRQW